MPAERRIEWVDAARDDLRATVFHMAKDDPQAALAVAERLELRASALALLSTWSCGAGVAPLGRSAVP